MWIWYLCITIYIWIVKHHTTYFPQLQFVSDTRHMRYLWLLMMPDGRYLYPVLLWNHCSSRTFLDASNLNLKLNLNLRFKRPGRTEREILPKDHGSWRIRKVNSDRNFGQTNNEWKQKQMIKENKDKAEHPLTSFKLRGDRFRSNCVKAQENILRVGDKRLRGGLDVTIRFSDKSFWIFRWSVCPSTARNFGTFSKEIFSSRGAQRYDRPFVK